MRIIKVLLFGILFVAIGVFLLAKENDIAKKCTEPILGTVVKIEESESYDSESGEYTYTYYPVIQYETKEKTVIKKYNFGTSRSKYSIGDKVNILYNPNNVEEYTIEGDSSLKLFGIIFIVAGVLVTVFGIFKGY